MNIIDVIVSYRFVTILSTPWTSMAAYKEGIIDKEGKILKKRNELKTPAEKAAYPDVFYTLCWNIKRILGKFGLKSSITNFATALWLLKEKYGGDNPKKFETLLTEHIHKNNISISHLLVEHITDTAITPGVYKLHNRTYRVKKTMTSIGEVFGIPLFRFGQKLFVLAELKRVVEDGVAAGGAAPTNSVGGGAIAGVSPGQEPPMPKNGSKNRKKLQRRKQERIKKDIQTLNVVAPSAIKRKVK